ncbi:hypothetical protein I302_100796 [Kwoniella bestiolae CBS 10118]|uniref:Bromodomain associated domain-containing protein n=1 Tax=Kwoniella bestiolae CBS 10118 TaxID=1296100 RepID=A0A1B9G647_9TREE|nr:hypothetical protein I302_04169 [Kwoniella bestiolae CBS 10118]OCF26483.1 hypothetical protein I302_04169 [Kwoniella bestiolae CBS 10118]
MSAPTPEAVIHLATLHTLAQAGFASTSKAASITLSTVIPKYLKVLATACVERASLAGRGKVAAIDVVDALDDLGIHVDELIDWGSEQNGDYFDDASMGNLQEYLQEGMSVEEGIAQMKLVPQAELDQEEDDEDTNEQEPKPEDADVMMEQDQEQEQAQDTNVKFEPDVDVEDEVEARPYIYRHKSPDFSWLPPLPSTNTIPQPQPTALSPHPEDPNQPSSETTSIPAPSQSIADRYRRPISYASSQLSQAHPFHDPPHPPSPLPLPPAPTSLPSLISTYAAIASDPSVALRQTDLRRQATELLRQSISTVDSYSPQPTLTTPIPPVRGSSIVPSHSDILPQKLLPVNPNSEDGLLSSLVHQITSPNLPYTLRERLTSLRPPVVQSRNDTPIFYNDAVKGPDDNALLKFKGKHTTDRKEDDEEGNGEREVWLKQTWDSGPRGLDKWSRPFLPKGKKVIIQKEGEKKPRMSDEDIRRIQEEEEERRVLVEKEKEREGKVKVNLRLPSFTGNGNGSITDSVRGEGATSNPLGSASPMAPTSSGTTPTPGIGIKLKLGGGGGGAIPTPKLSISPGPPNSQAANKSVSIFGESV